MKIFISQLLFLNFLFILPLFSKELLRLGSSSYPNLVKFSKSGVSGVAVDYINKNLEEKFDIQWVEIPIPRAISSIENNRIDSYLGIVPSPERKKLVDFAEKAIFGILPTTCTKKEYFEKKNAIELSDLRDKTVAYPSNSIILPAFKDLNIEFINISYSDEFIERMIKVLNSKRVDFIHLPEGKSIKPFIEKHNLLCNQINDPLNITLAFKKNSLWKKKINSLNIPKLHL